MENVRGSLFLNSSSTEEQKGQNNLPKFQCLKLSPSLECVPIPV